MAEVYATARFVLEAAQSGFEHLFEPRVRAIANSLTFICASAGNHGIAVAAGAKLFGARARVHLPRSAPVRFAARLEELGAHVCWSGDAYDDALEHAREDARIAGGILLADSAASLDDRGPALVMEGYTIIGRELQEHFERIDVWPTHVFLQAGVGSLAAALACHIRRHWPAQPEIIVVEPEAAACLQASHGAGRSTRVDGPPSSMHRLDCKAPSLLALPILSAAEVRYATVTDAQAQSAVEALQCLGVATTHSGAAGYAAFRNYLQRSPPRVMRPLVLATEGRAPTTSSHEDAKHA